MTANLCNAFLNGPPLDNLFVTVPTTVVAGQPFTIDVTAADSLGNPIAQYGGTLHFTSSDTGTKTVLPADSKLTKGLGSFSVTLSTAGSQTLTVADDAAAKSTTVPITVTAGSAAGLALSVRGTAASLDVVVPATAKAGTAFSVAVTAKNSDGTTATGYNGTVHFTSSDTSTGVVLPPDSPLTNGQGTFSATLAKAGTQ